MECPNGMTQGSIRAPPSPPGAWITTPSYSSRSHKIAVHDAALNSLKLNLCGSRVGSRIGGHQRHGADSFGRWVGLLGTGQPRGGDNAADGGQYRWVTSTYAHDCRGLIASECRNRHDSRGDVLVHVPASRKHAKVKAGKQSICLRMCVLAAAPVWISIDTVCTVLLTVIA